MELLVVYDVIQTQSFEPVHAFYSGECRQNTGSSLEASLLSDKCVAAQYDPAQSLPQDSLTPS